MQLPQKSYVLYISLVRSQLIYCSQIWRPYLLKDIITLERIRRATKFILNDYQLSYRFHLVKLHLRTPTHVRTYLNYMTLSLLSSL